MFCETCIGNVETGIVDGQTACLFCGTILAGGPVVRAENLSRRGVRGKRETRGVSHAFAESSITAGLGRDDRDALRRTAEAHVAAAFSGGRAPSSAARAIAERTLEGSLVQVPRADTMQTAEDIVAAVDRRAVGRGNEAASLLRRARQDHGACVVSEETSEGAWCLAAVAAATVGHPGGVDDELLQTRAAEAAIRCDLPLKSVCGPAIAEVWRFGCA
jgi:hypothetical protein